MLSKHRDDLGVPCDLYCSRAAGTAAVITRRKFSPVFQGWFFPPQPFPPHREQELNCQTAAAGSACLNPSLIKAKQLSRDLTLNAFSKPGGLEQVQT